MNLQSNDFELFNLPVQFNQDRSLIDTRWKELQREAHPDKFASHGAAAQRVAMQWSVRINEAHQRLKDPIKRATYLCELHGAPINAENNTAMPTDFLMQQMELRETLDEADSADKLDELHEECTQLLRSMLTKAEQLIDTQKDFAAAAQSVRALMFIDKFQQDIDKRIEAIE
jgi:molecular chaperone HscB